MAVVVTIGKIVDLLTKIPHEMLQTIYHLIERLNGSEGKLWHENLKQFLKMELVSENGPILRQIETENSIEILWVSPGQPLQRPICVFLYEMVRNGSFKTIFGSLGEDFGSLCLEEEQIEAFIFEYPDLLRKEGYATFFLFEKSGELLVKVVRVYEAGPRIHDELLSHNRVWPAECKHRLVVPAMIKS